MGPVSSYLRDVMAVTWPANSIARLRQEQRPEVRGRYTFAIVSHGIVKPSGEGRVDEPKRL